jgi:hypothetical protein
VHSLVGRGDPPQADGSSFFVDVDVLRTTANHHLITQGLAYPTYYRALFPDLRNEFTAVAKQARDGGLGVWASDATTSGADVTGLAALQNDIVIVPKLFRRGPPTSRGRLDCRVPRVPRSDSRQVLHSVHRALDNRTGRHRASHRQGVLHLLAGIFQTGLRLIQLPLVRGAVVTGELAGGFFCLAAGCPPDVPQLEDIEFIPCAGRLADRRVPFVAAQ